jgi:uncharacterized protein
MTGAQPHVIWLFAIFHDSCRENEGWDPKHGLRGAEFAKSLRTSAFNISDEDFGLLHSACEHHTDGQNHTDVTIQTCWDADRLDLGRVGIRPDVRYLCTEAAKDPKMIAWAHARSTKSFVPDIVSKWDVT